MEKKLLLILVVWGMLFSNNVFPQLSTRENDAITEKLGARPVAGDAALTFGFSIVGQEKASLYDLNMLGSGDLLTFRYFMSDDMAVRLGLRLYKSTTKSSGDLLEPDELNPLSANEYKSSQREYVIVPGIEKHFSASNIFDVYAGADLYLGFGRDKTIENEEYVNGDYEKYTSTKPTTIAGVGGVVGFNVFIAQLPVSLGLEYGWNAKWIFGNKTKVESDYKWGDVSKSVEFYTQETNGLGDPDNNRYSSLNKGEFNMDGNQNVRIVLNIYFSK